MKSLKVLWRSPLTVPTLVALTSLAAGAVLAPAVNATFLMLAAFACGALALAGQAAVLVLRKPARAATPGCEMSESSAAVDAAGDCPSFIVLPAHARADEVTHLSLAHQSYFPVRQGREIVGVLSKGRLLSALARGKGDHLIAELMYPAGRAQPANHAHQAPP